jgi:predicted nucleic acid-binding protein
VNLMVDTSVWSLALRRDAPPGVPQVAALKEALKDGKMVVTTGLILQEILQGFLPTSTRVRIAMVFASIGTIQPTRADHVAAAELRNCCRRAGVQTGTVDALIAALCIRYSLTLLTTDRDFEHAAPHCGLRLWSPNR